MTPHDCVEWLEMICRDLREQGSVLPQVRIDREGVGPYRSVVEEMELLASTLRIALNGDASDGHVELSRITIRRALTPQGRDLVSVEQDNGSGADLAVVEALGLLQLAIYDVSNAPAEGAE